MLSGSAAGVDVRRLMYQPLICSGRPRKRRRDQARRLAAPLDAKLVECAADALVDGMGADPQLGGDFLAAVMAIDQQQAFDLAFGSAEPQANPDRSNRWTPRHRSDTISAPTFLPSREHVQRLTPLPLLSRIRGNAQILRASQATTQAIHTLKSGSKLFGYAKLHSVPTSWELARSDGGEGWIRTSVGRSPADLQSAAFNHSATSPGVGRRAMWRPATGAVNRGR